MIFSGAGRCSLSCDAFDTRPPVGNGLRHANEYPSGFLTPSVMIPQRKWQNHADREGRTTRLDAALRIQAQPPRRMPTESDGAEQEQQSVRNERFWVFRLGGRAMALILLADVRWRRRPRATGPNVLTSRWRRRRLCVCHAASVPGRGFTTATRRFHRP